MATTISIISTPTRMQPARGMFAGNGIGVEAGYAGGQRGQRPEEGQVLALRIAPQARREQPGQAAEQAEVGRRREQQGRRAERAAAPEADPAEQPEAGQARTGRRPKAAVRVNSGIAVSAKPATAAKAKPKSSSCACQTKGRRAPPAAAVRARGRRPTADQQRRGEHCGEEERSGSRTATAGAPRPSRRAGRRHRGASADSRSADWPLAAALPGRSTCVPPAPAAVGRGAMDEGRRRACIAGKPSSKRWAMRPGPAAMTSTRVGQAHGLHQVVGDHQHRQPLRAPGGRAAGGAVAP
jgi:hypothetical protein